MCKIICSTIILYNQLQTKTFHVEEQIELDLRRHRSTQRAGLAYGGKSPSFNSTRCSIVRGSESIRFQAIAVTTGDIQNNVLNCRRLYRFPLLAKATEKTTDLSTLITIVIKRLKDDSR